MDIAATVVSADNFLSFAHVKASKSIVTTEPCLLTCPAVSLCGRYFNIDLHTVVVHESPDS